MKIGVIGYKGRLGSELVNKLDIHGFEPIDCDITNPISIDKGIGDKYYDCIVNCSAYTDVDKAETDLLRAYNVNAFGPQNLATVYKGYIVHISSDYIFDGLSGPYSENYFPSPVCSYGFTKFFGEVALRPYMDRSLIIRTTILYDNSNRPNFVTSVYDLLKAGQWVRAPKTIIGNPTYVPHLAHGILYSINKEIKGVLNISGLTRLSRYDLAKEIAIFFNFDQTKVLNIMPWGDAKRPEKCGFILDRAKSLGVPLYTLWEGLDAYQQERKGLEIERQIN